MKTFLEFLQSSVGAEYPLEQIFDNLHCEEVAEEVEKYAKEYALSCIEASLIKAAENAQAECIMDSDGGSWYVNESSITDPSNHVLL